MKPFLVCPRSGGQAIQPSVQLLPGPTNAIRTLFLYVNLTSPHVTKSPRPSPSYAHTYQTLEVAKDREEG